MQVSLIETCNSEVELYITHERNSYKYGEKSWQAEVHYFKSNFSELLKYLEMHRSSYFLDLLFIPMHVIVVVKPNSDADDKFTCHFCL